MKIINKLKTAKGMALSILVLFSLVLGLSYGTFIFSTGNYRSTSMLISDLLYGIELTSTGGDETINSKTVTLPSGKTSTILLKITSLNDVESKYGVSYKINSGTGSVKYSSNTGWLPTGKINKNGTGTYEKVVKIVIEATSDLSVDFNVDGGYTYNDLKETKEGYTRVTEMYEGITDYTESLKTIIENETSNNIYGGDAINNYLQYPEDTDTTKNIWRIIGYYDSVDGIKIIANPVKETSTTNISTELTTFYNTLTKKSDYVLETNKFSCTGLNCTTSTYSNIGLLNTSEYSYIGGINSYLNENDYYVLDGTTIKNITSGIITEASTTSNLRPVIYLQSDVKVKGSGTITNPYKLSEKGDVVFASATLNGTSISFPKESDPYIPKTVTCTNGSVGEWDDSRRTIRLTTVNLPTSCVVDFTEGYTVTLNVINGSTSPVSKVVGRDGVASFTVTPNDGYQLELELNSCNGTLNNNIYTINGITNNITCSISLKQQIPTLYNKLLADNPTRLERTDFSTVFEETNTGTLYKTTEDGTTVYYFAGQAQNNWVKFGNFYWRIIRTNKDGGIRLLYHGDSASATMVSIADTVYNNSKYDAMYVGYMYGPSGSLESNRTNTTDSVLKKKVDTWYKNNLISYENYLSTTAVYCNDRTAENYSINGNFSFKGLSAYGTSVITPSYDCKNVGDAFTVDPSSGNGNLTYPIAIMTADEAIYAGARWGTKCNNYVMLNGDGGQSVTTTTSSTWTLTPNDYQTNLGYILSLGNFTNYGALMNNHSQGSNGTVRPVVSLKSCVKYSSGDGSPSSPYTILETESGC